MADTVNKSFFDALLDVKAAKWSAGVAFDRSNPLPLDQWSVFKDLAAAEAYLTNAKAYPGQIIAYAEADTPANEETGVEFKAGGMVACVLSSNAAGTGLELKRIGIIPSGDNKTIEVSATGAIALLGASGAANGTLPMIGDDGKLTWKTLEDIGAGDGNDNTTYTFDFANKKITITPALNGVAQDSVELDLATFITADELANVVGKAAEGETAATGLYKVIADALQEAKTYADDNDANDNTEYHLEYDSENKEIKLVAGANADSMVIDATPFIKDGMLEKVEYNADNNTLTFTWNTASGLTTDEVVLSDIIEPYTAGNGLNLADNAFSVKLAEGNESFLTVDENGVKLSGVQSAIDTALQSAKDYADNKEHKNTTYDISSNGVSITLTPSEGDAKTVSIDAYTKSEADTKIDEKIASVTGGESAADVKLALESYRDALNKEVWGDDAGSWTTTITEDGKTVVTYVPKYGDESRIDRLEKVGAQANVIEAVEVNNGTAEGTPEAKLTATLSGKTVTINDSAIQALITAAQNKANEAASAASNAQSSADANAQNIQTNTSDISNLKTLTEGHTSKISALETANSTHAAEFEALSGTVQTHGTDIAGLKTGKADTTVTDALAGRITANENSLKTLNETTIPGINTEIGKKANADAVYTKTEIGAIAENKTLVQMIEEAQTAATYDDTAIKTLIQVNTDAVSTLNGSDAGKSVRTIAGEEVAKVIDSAPEAYDTLKEIADWIANDETGAAAMGAAIVANTAAIGVKAEGDTAATGLYKYTDDSIAALQASIHGVDDKTIKLNENKAYVAEVSTDILVQGTMELVFSAGNATGYNV